MYMNVYTITCIPCTHVYTGGRTAQMNLVEHWTKKVIHKTDTCAALIPQYDYEIMSMSMPVWQRTFLPESTFTFELSFSADSFTMFMQTPSPSVIIIHVQ